MRGWKTKFGALLMALAGVAPVIVPEYADQAVNILSGIGMCFGIWGVGHKIEKQGNL